MKILKILVSGIKKRDRKSSGSYNQQSIEQAGRDQLLKLVEKGITFQISGLN